MNTRIHSLWSLLKTEETDDTDENNGNSKVYEHLDKNTGITRTMGEGEIKRFLRVYVKRVLEHEKKLKELLDSGETEQMILKTETALENNRKQETYWKQALDFVTAKETAETDVMLKAA